MLFLQRNSILAWYLLSSCVCFSVCPLHAGIVLDWLDLGSCKQCHMIAQELKQCHMIAQELRFSGAKDLSKMKQKK